MLIIVLCTTTTPTAVATSAGSRRPAPCAFGSSMDMESPVGRAFSGERFAVPFYHSIVVIATDLCVGRACGYPGPFENGSHAERFPAIRWACKRMRRNRCVDNQLGVAAHSGAPPHGETTHPGARDEPLFRGLAAARHLPGLHDGAMMTSSVNQSVATPAQAEAQPLNGTVPRRFDALLLDFGSVITFTAFERHRDSERALGLAHGTFRWLGPVDPDTDPLW